MNELFITLFFTLSIPLLIWGLFGLVNDVRYWFTYDTKDNRPE